MTLGKGAASVSVGGGDGGGDTARVVFGAFESPAFAVVAASRRAAVSAIATRASSTTGAIQEAGSGSGGDA